ncbi:MAG: ABC transporter substrate-binding protein [Candidatus Lokiarchaeota archaeon]|nr:ABC transporter substrate-binding protein [Candidatus Harpocratesius repetitus]
MNKTKKTMIFGLLLGFLMVMAMQTHERYYDFSKLGIPDSAEDSDELSFTYASKLSAEMDTFDPMFFTLNTEQHIINQVAEPLFGKLSTDGDYEPILADSITQIDTVTYKVSLKENITFQDGSEMNASAVEWNFRRLYNAVTYLSSSLADTMYISSDIFRGLSYLDLSWVPEGAPVYIINETKVIDNYNVEFKLNVPYDIYSIFEDVFIISPTTHADFINATMTTDDGLVGTGAYTIESYSVTESEVILKAYENYWGGAPDVKKLIFSFVENDDARHISFLAGEIDMIDAPDNDQLKDAENITIMEAGADPSSFYIALFDTIDIKVREALNFAFDYNYIIEEVKANASVRSGGAIFKSVDYHNDTLDLPGYDLEYARQVLIDAGIAPSSADSWSDTDWQTIADGESPLYSIKIGYISPLFDDYIVVFNDACRNLGIKLDSISYDQANFIGFITSNSDEDIKNTFDCFVMGVGFGTSIYHLLMRLHLSTGFFNIATLNDTIVDDLINDFLTASNNAERQDIANQIADRIQNVLFAYIWIDQAKNQIAYQNKWTGINPYIFLSRTVKLAGSSSDDTGNDDSGEKIGIPGYSTGFIGIAGMLSILFITRKRKQNNIKTNKL